MTPELEILLIASLTAMACVIPGVFLVLRGLSLMSDAISHAILLGIVLAFFWTQNLNSPWLIIGAAAAGVLTVALTELLISTQRLKKDAAIGLVFPVFFSIGVLLINKYANDIHIDTDAVLLGELAFAPFHRLILGGLDLGPVALWTMGVILVLNTVFLLAVYKELKLVTFDEGLATALGFSPILLHYALMSLTSVTAVGAFDAVGSILVVALIIVPPASAYLITTRLLPMIVLSVGLAIASSFLGYGTAYLLNLSISGSMVTWCGILFFLCLIFSPYQGVLLKWSRLRRQRIFFAVQMVLVQLIAHEGQDNERSENTIENLVNHMGWPLPFAKKVCQLAVQSNWMVREDHFLRLTPLGREKARMDMTRV